MGMVADGEAVWLYDAERERWVYCDGTQLSTYAASAGPGRPSDAPVHPGTDEVHVPEPEPTQIVDAARPAAYHPADTVHAGPTQLRGGVDGPGRDTAHPPTRTGDA
ncbi:hypothetical protein [Streptomyces sp. NBC_01727]|uniref:hypothetical protein n=1 Tax=Streptomyces sp. NBC_01727 TaxID=2975924 RepID=UPI003FA3AC78